MTDAEDRQLYLNNLRQSLKNEGHFIVSTFAEDGALKCSGLDVQRYSVEEMQKTLGSDFKLLQSFREAHQTPFNTVQSFIYAHFQFKKKIRKV